MSSLFDDSSDSENSSFGMNGESDTDDSATTFTVATVLQKRRGSSVRSRRDTITRTMPTVSIHDSLDKYAMPTTVERKHVHHHLSEERTQLRVTESLMDDSSADTEKENHGTFRRDGKFRDSDVSGLTSRGSVSGSIFRTPHRDINDDLANKSTVVWRNKASLDASKQINLLDEESANDSEFVNSPNDSEQSNRRRSSDKFMSVYADLAAKKAQSSAQTKDRDGGYATAKAANVKSLVTTALKTVAEGLVAHATSNTCDGIGTWDVDNAHHVSGKKRSLDIDGAGDNNNDRQRNRRKSLNIRAEMTLLQDMVQERTGECAILKRVSAQLSVQRHLDFYVVIFNASCFTGHILSQQLEESQSQSQSGRELLSCLQSENNDLVLTANEREETIKLLEAEKKEALTKASSQAGTISELQEKAESLAAELDASKSEINTVIQSKVILESKLALSREAASAANAHAKSLSCRLKDSQSESEKLRSDLQVERDRLEELVSELERTRKELAKKERESSLRVELQGKMDEMRNALQQIKDVERDRKEKTKLIESELQEARDALSTANSKVFESEAAVTSLRCAMDELKRDNQSLRDPAQTKRDTPAQWKIELKEETEGIEIETNRATPQSSQLDNINALGAEDAAGSELSEHVSKLPLMAILQRTPDSSSRQLSFASSKSMSTPRKENHPQLQSECSLCCRPRRTNAAIRRCQCGRDDCTKWAHVSCVLNRKSVSNCVSHPGTPAPSLPMILCEGIWRNKLAPHSVYESTSNN